MIKINSFTTANEWTTSYNEFMKQQRFDESSQVYPVWRGHILTNAYHAGFGNLTAAKRAIKAGDFVIPDELLYEKFVGVENFVKMYHALMPIDPTNLYSASPSNGKGGYKNKSVDIPGLYRPQFDGTPVCVAQHPQAAELQADLDKLVLPIPTKFDNIEEFNAHIEFEQKWGMYPTRYYKPYFVKEFYDHVQSIRKTIEKEVQYFRGCIASRTVNILMEDKPL